MKKLIKVFICFVLVLVLSAPFTVFAKDKGKKEAKTVKAPTLQSISFNDAEIEQEFSPTEFNYTISVDNANTPTLKDYKVSKGAEIFVTYNSDDVVKGINVEVKNEALSANYFFEYDSDEQIVISSNNNLKSLECELGQVFPALNGDDTKYSLYIPNDMTQLNLMAVPEDLGAQCNLPGTITMNESQTPVFDITVVSSDGSAKAYTFEVKRLDLNSKELLKALEQQDFESLIKNESFHKRPEFRIIVVSTLAGFLLILIAISLLKRIAVKAEDEDELEFFAVESSDENE